MTFWCYCSFLHSFKSFFLLLFQLLWFCRWYNFTLWSSCWLFLFRISILLFNLGCSGLFMLGVNLLRSFNLLNLRTLSYGHFIVLIDPQFIQQTHHIISLAFPLLITDPHLHRLLRRLRRKVTMCAFSQILIFLRLLCYCATCSLMFVNWWEGCGLLGLIRDRRGYDFGLLSLLDEFLELTVEIVESLEKIEWIVFGLVVHAHVSEGLYLFALLDFSLDQLTDISCLFHPLLILWTRLFGIWAGLYCRLHRVECLMQLLGVEIVDIGCWR